MSNNKIGITQILQKLSPKDLFGLANTVTHGLAKNSINTANEALDCILQNSADDLSILKRKVVTRELLFTYLNENNISVPTPVTKPELINKILTFWQSTETYNEETGEIDERNYELSITNNQDIPNVHLLAKKFAEWFYSLLNGNQPIDIEHFWPDSRIKIKMPASFIEISDDVIEIVNALYKTKSDNNLYFNPNLTHDGTQGRINVYGLVLVLCCGTLHVNNQIVGVYEQVFSLARDPSADNNWKIKNTELNLVNKSNVYSQPSLCENELTGNLLSLPDC